MTLKWSLSPHRSSVRLFAAKTRTKAQSRPQPRQRRSTTINSKLLLIMSSGSLIPFTNDIVLLAVFRNEYDLNLTRRAARQIDRTDALLGGFNGRDQESHPLQRPTGEKTRKTYDFTKTHHVGLSCHDIQASQGTLILISIKRSHYIDCQCIGN